MDDQYNQEYRSYGSYIGRIIAIVVAFALLVAAVWFVVRLASDNDDTIGDGTRNSIALEDTKLDDNNDSEETPAEDTNDTDEDTSPDTSNGQAETPTDDGADDNNTGTDTTDAPDDEEDTPAVTPNTGGSAAADTEGHVLSTNTDALPSTGASLGWLMVLPVVAYGAARAVLSAKRD